MQYQLNDADKYDKSKIDIISHYWKQSNRILVASVTGLYTQSDDAMNTEDVKVYYTDTLALYIIRIWIGGKSFREFWYSMEHESWLKLSKKFINDKTRCIARLVRILGTNSLEEVFGSQVTLVMLWPLRFLRLLLDRLNKHSELNRWRSNNGNLKCGIRFPRNAKEEAQFDKYNGNYLWENAIIK